MSNRRNFLCETGCGNLLNLTDHQYATRSAGHSVRCEGCGGDKPRAFRKLSFFAREPQPTARTARKRRRKAVKKAAQVKRAAKMPKPPKPTFAQRRASLEAEPGVTVTVRNQARGTLVTIQRCGESLDALEAVCATLDRLPGDWRVISLSTPGTILRDLIGDRNDHPPERSWLRMLGREDLLEDGTVRA